jgi:hypothetical protein
MCSRLQFFAAQQRYSENNNYGYGTVLANWRLPTDCGSVKRIKVEFVHVPLSVEFDSAVIAAILQS